MDDPDPGRRDHITPPTRDVKPGSHTYRDTDDLREEADEDDEDEHMEKGEGSNLLFGGDDEDFDDFEGDEDVGEDTIRKSRIKLLAGMIWAELGEPDAVVEESAPNELSIRVQDLSWKVSLDDDGRVTISGFDSGAEQYVGVIDEENAETQIVKIADNVQQLIAEDIDEKAVPPEPPVHYGPDDTNVVEQPEGGAMTPPAAPGGDQGIMGMPEDPLAPLPGEGAAGGVEAFPPPAGGLPAPTAPAPGGVPPAAPPGVGAPPAPFPAASRRRRMVMPARVVRVANARLDEVSNQLENIGESLGDDGEEVFSKLADRVRRVVDLLR